MAKNNGNPIKIKAYEDNCSICYELWNESSPWVFQCGHMICEKCYLHQKRVKRVCHICRDRYNLKKKRKYKKNRNYVSESETTSESDWE